MEGIVSRVDDSTGHTLAAVIGRLRGYGERPAVLAVRDEGVERWSYARLGETVWGVARGLAEAGVERGDRVALLAPNGPAWIAACLGSIVAGAVVVPLDVQAGDEALAGSLEDSGAGTIFTTAEGAERLDRLGVAGRSSVYLLDGEERSWGRLVVEGELWEPEFDAEEIAALFYTSGTTGKAKGVPLSHGNLGYQVEAVLGAGVISEDERVLLPLPLHHVYPFVMGMLVPLAAGLPIIMPRSLTGPEIVRALREGEVSLIVGVPRLYEALFAGIESRVRGAGRIPAALFGAALGLGAWSRRRLGLKLGDILLGPVRRRFGPGLRVLASGGAPLDPRLAERLEALGWRVAVGYGLTETAPLLTLNPPDGKKLRSAGRPVPGTEIRLDAAAVSGEDGEILARGPGVFGGYRDLPEETRKVLTRDGWFRTGDLGHLDEDGYLYVSGRASTLIVTGGGKNVQPEDVEEAYREDAVVKEIGVLQRGGRLVALVVPDMTELRRRETEDVEGEVRRAIEAVSRKLPTYRRVSDYAVSREPLEYTQLGKLRRHILEERYERARSGDSGAVGPAGPIPIEEMSAEDRELLGDARARGVWEVLAARYPDRRLTPGTSLGLDLGVDSMEWVELTMEIGDRAGVEIGEETIANVEVVRDLLYEAAGGSAGDGIRRRSPLEAPQEALDAAQKRWLSPLSPAAALLSRGLFAANRAVARAAFRLRVEGVQDLPPGRYVFAPNHLSYVDALVVAAALRPDMLRRTYWAGWTGAAFGNPLMRLVSRLGRVVPIDPDRGGASSLAFGAAALERGNNLVWFPEGQRSLDGGLGAFKSGLGRILVHHPAVVVPVAIRGTREVMKPGSMLLRPSKVTVAFGEPVEVATLEREGRGERPQDRIMAALRDRVSGMLEGEGSKTHS